MPHVLIVDDDLSYLLGISELVTREGSTTSTAASLKEAREEILRRVPDVVLLDSNLPDGNGIELLEELQQHPGTDVVFITGNASLQDAVEAIRRGASNYLTKPLDFDRIRPMLESVAQTRKLKVEIGELRGALRKLGRFESMIGAAPAIQSVYDLIARAAPSDITVLVLGETGTGKELVARAVHDLSRRSAQPFVAMNCGAVSPMLIESELFGHERGSFTGADRTHRGLFESASGGTLFLDEITEMPLELQVKLLRVLETRTFLRVGSQNSMAADVRVIAASNQSPTEAVANQKLREDLLYRLNVFPIQLPPLRERPGDVELLAEHFLDSLNQAEGTRKQFSRAALQRMQGHSWPGNVRELRNVVQRAFVLGNETIGIDCVPVGVEAASTEGLSVKIGTSLAEAERRLILATLEHCEGNKAKATEVLGISVKTLYNRLNEYRALMSGK